MLNEKQKELITILLKNYMSKKPNAYDGDEANLIWLLLEEGILNRSAFSNPMFAESEFYSIGQDIQVHPLTEKGKKLFETNQRR